MEKYNNPTIQELREIEELRREIKVISIKTNEN